MVLLRTGLLLLCTVLHAVAGTTLVRMELGHDDHPQAVCNDGTRAVYYHTPNPAPKSGTVIPTARPSHFVIYLQGGYFCDTVEKCDVRCKKQTPYFCTTMRLKVLDDVSALRQGILSDDNDVNPTFADYYKVYLHYCTSDMYTGERAASEKTGGYHFQGWAVFTALVNSLHQHAGLSEATQVVLTGTSAGGRGVAFTCPYLRRLLPPSVDVRCVVDAAIFYPQPFVSGCQSFNELIVEANAFWHGTVRDFDVHTWWRTYPVPLFIAIQSHDTYAHLYYCIDPNNPEHLREYGRRVERLAGELAREHPKVGLFMPSCNRHPMLTYPHFYSAVRAGGEDGLTLEETLGNWMRGEGRWHAWDDCAAASHAVCNPRCDDPNHHDFDPIRELELTDKGEKTASPEAELYVLMQLMWIMWLLYT